MKISAIAFLKPQNECLQEEILIYVALTIALSRENR